MKRNLFVIALSAFIIINFSSAQQSLDGIAAVIGDEIILKSEIDAYTSMRLSGIGQHADTDEFTNYRKQFLQEMIDGKVLIAHAKKDSTISVTEMDVDNALNNHILMLLKQNTFLCHCYSMKHFLTLTNNI